MKIFGFHIVHEDIVNLYAKKCAEVMALDKAINRKNTEYNELNGYYQALQKKYADLQETFQQQREDLLYRDDLIRDLKAKIEDLKFSNTELSERLEKEQSDNCELQNLYSEKCKECDEAKDHAIKLADSYNRIAEEKATLEAAKKAAEEHFEKCYGIYEREGYVIVKEDIYNKIKAVYDKKQIETRNANRRKNRAAKAAAKKVAQGKPE